MIPYDLNNHNQMNMIYDKLKVLTFNNLQKILSKPNDELKVKIENIHFEATIFLLLKNIYSVCI